MPHLDLFDEDSCRVVAHDARRRQASKASVVILMFADDSHVVPTSFGTTLASHEKPS